MTSFAPPGDNRFSAGVERKTKMNLPKMILFDYGQTLGAEESFDGLRGTKAVMQYAVKNKYQRTAEEVQAVAERINRELGRGNPATRHLAQIEVPNHMFTSYLYVSQGIELSLTPAEIDRVFWSAASPAKPTEGIGAFLRYLDARGIRTGVISNITYDETVVKDWIRALIPDHAFEFILATSSYLYRKPHPGIFRLALEMADLPAEDVWYIGDDYKCDVEGARGAGLYPVWYIGAHSAPPEPKPDVLTVQNWQELQTLLDGADTL